MIKKLPIIASILLIAAVCFGAITWQRYLYFKNTGGLNNAFSPIAIEDDEASDLQNVILTTYGAFETRGGFRTINPSKPGACTGIKYVKFSNGDKFLVGTFADDKIRAMAYDSSGPTGTWVDITSDPINVGQNDLSSFIIAQDTLIIEDGVNTTRPFMWHGDVLLGACELTTGPPNASIFAYHKNIGFAAGNSTAKSTLYFTDVGNIRNWTTGLSGNLNVETNDGSIIRALVPGFDALYIFKDYSIWRLTGSDKDSFQLQRMVQGIGCISPKSIALLGNTFFFISSQGDVYLYDGAVNLTLLSTKIDGTLDNALFSRFPYASGLVFDKDYYLSLTSSTQTTNDTIMVYDTFNSAWTKFQAMNVNAMDVADDGTGKDTLIFGNYHGDIFKYPLGTTDYHEDAILAYYTTKQYLFPEVAPNKAVTILKVFTGEETSSNTLFVDVLPDFSVEGFASSMDITADDIYTELLLHFNGVNTSTNIVDSSTSNHTITTNGNAKLSTAQYKFSGVNSTSCSFDGTGDYLSLVNSADYDFGNPASAFTIDYWVYPTSFTGYNGHISSSGNTAGNYSWQIYTLTNGVVKVDINGIGGADTITSGNQSLTLNAWNHVALVCKGSGATDVNFYINGVAGDAPGTGNNNWNSWGQGIVIGRIYQNEDDFYFDGWIDELRISKGIARYTTDFTPPTFEYSSADNLKIGRFEVNKEGSFYQIKYSGNAPFEVKGWEIFVDSSDRI